MSSRRLEESTLIENTLTTTKSVVKVVTKYRLYIFYKILNLQYEVTNYFYSLKNNIINFCCLVKFKKGIISEEYFYSYPGQCFSSLHGFSYSPFRERILVTLLFCNFYFNTFSNDLMKNL